MPQDFGAAGVKKTLTTIPVKKPSKESFFQVHPDPSYRLQTMFIELKDDNEFYLVSKKLWSELVDEATFGVRQIFTGKTRQGVLFLWPVRLPGPDGKIDTWNASAMEAAQRAQGNWIRMVSNRDLGAYEVFEPVETLPPPVWPEKPFEELLQTAFRNRYIDSPDHIVLKRLRGEV